MNWTSDTQTTAIYRAKTGEPSKSQKKPTTTEVKLDRPMLSTIRCVPSKQAIAAELFEAGWRSCVRATDSDNSVAQFCHVPC